MTDVFKLPPANYFQMSNAYVDEFLPYLAGDEFKVLTFAIRHILGWHDKAVARRAPIALSVFVNGFTTRDGARYGGTSLSEATVRKCLRSLTKYGLLIAVGKATALGQVWQIGDTINRGELISRAELKATANANRTVKGRAAKGVVPHNPSVSSVSSHNTPEVLSHNTHIKTSTKTKEKDSVTASLVTGDASSSSHTPEATLGGDWPQGIEVSYLSKKPTSPSQSPSPSLKQSVSTAEDTTPSIPLVPPRPLSPAPKVRSEKQLANDALVEAFRAAWFEGRSMVIPDSSGDEDMKLYGMYAHRLVKAGVPQDKFLAYVQYWVKAARETGGWTLTLHALTNGGRMDDFKSFHATEQRRLSHPAKQGYDKRKDPAYAYLYAAADEGEQSQ